VTRPDSIRIVVAEDQALVLGAIAALLDLEPDMTVVGRAANGAAAVECVRALLPDILLTDIEMPEMTGIDAARLLSEAGATTRTVIVTTFARPGYLARSRAAGVRGYLLKDSPVEQLADAIREVARGGIVVPPDLASAAWDHGADPLTQRERDALRLADEGLSNKEIAIRLTLSPGTVRNYLSEGAAKLGASNRIEAGRIARLNGWL